MEKLQFSIRQATALAAGAVFVSLALFSLGLATASALSHNHEAVLDQPQVTLAESTAPPVPDPSSKTCDTVIGMPAPEAPVTAADKVPTPEWPSPRFGLQVAVFESMDNALKYVAPRQDAAYPARIYSRKLADNRLVYPVLVGIFDSMEAAQDGKQHFLASHPVDAFVTDAAGLVEEPVLNSTLAMLR